MMKDEKGVALPLVIGFSVMMFIMISVCILHSLRGRQTGKLYIEALRASYAAESGIARAQAKLRTKGRILGVEIAKINNFTVRTVTSTAPLQVRATAYGRMGVRQTVKVELDEKSYEVKNWIKSPD